MSFNLLITIQTQSIGRFALQTLKDSSYWKTYFIDEVGWLNGPALGDFVALNLNLSGEDAITNLSSRLANIGPSTIHAFIGYDTDRKIIGCYTMILSTHHFRSHISRSTWSLWSIIWTPISRDTEIRQSQVAICLEYQVLWLDISVNDAGTVDCI